MRTNFDAIIVGTGQAGPHLAERLAAAGRQVAIIERHRFGGTCVNTGCIPTKALVASAAAAQMARRAADYGLRVAGLEVDMAAVKARTDAISGKSRLGVERWLRGLERVSVIEGHARFTGPRRITVDGRVLEAERVFLNVGGRAVVPPVPGLDRVPYLTNSSVLELDTLPEHLVVVGGSYIGLEFAQIFRRLGAQVTVIEMQPRLIPREDPEVSAAVAEILSDEGIALRLGTSCLEVEPDGDRIAARIDCRDCPPVVLGSHLLLAVGRRPNTDDLGLEAAGIATDERGYVTVDEELRTSAPGVWALGDCNGRGAFTHTSYNDAEIVAANLLDGASRRLGDRIPAYALFTDPPLGRAGMTEAEVRDAGIPALVARLPMSRVGRAVEKGETAGFMKILVARDSGRILGAAILGTGGDEVIHAVLDVMAAGAPYTLLQRTMHIHPTVSEFLPTLLGQLEPLAAEPEPQPAR